MLTCKDPSVQKWVDEVNQALPRCLGLMDRQALSKTFGCFDKDFWHFRTKDFSSAAAQMSVLSLAKILDLQERGFLESPWTKERLLQLIQGGFDYTWTLQHNDGSFDEWYPNERGWGGPTGYMLYALCETFQVLKKHATDFRAQDYLERIRLSAKFQSGRPESGTLANHYAISLLALWKAFEVTSDQEFKQAFEKLRKSFLKLCSPEGWSLEYDGFDAGYNLASVSFLSRLPRLHEDEELHQYCRASLKFLSLFVYPDGSFGGAPCSRHTGHNYPYAWAFWAAKEKIAASVLARAFSGEFFSLSPRLGDQDDHYLHYRLWDFLDGIAVLGERPFDQETASSALLPWEDSSLLRDFPEAGILAVRRGSSYLILSYRRGGAFLLFDVTRRKRISLLNHYLLRESSGKLFSPQFIQQSPTSWKLQDDELYFEGVFDFLPVFNQVFSPFKNWVFRSLLGAVQLMPFSAHALKGFIRRLMILDRQKARARLKRSLFFSRQGLKLADVIEVPAVSVQVLSRSTEVFSRYVPQNRYFLQPEGAEERRIADLSTEWITEVNF